MALNVTVTEPTVAGYLTVWPAGGAMPSTSNLNMLARQTVPNFVVVGLGSGHISIRNAFGSAHVIVDVMGWFSSDFQPIQPARVHGHPPRPMRARSFPPERSARWPWPVPAVYRRTGVSAVALNLTVTEPASAGYLTVWPAGGPVPATSNLNFVPNQTVPNLVVVGVGSSGHVAIRNGSSHTAHVVVDLMGWFDGTSNFTANGTCDVVQPRPDPTPNPTSPITKVLWIWEENSNPDLLIGTCPTAWRCRT